MKILITGSNGLLGQKLVAQCLKNGIIFLATSKDLNRNSDCPEDKYHSLDITNPVQIKDVFDLFQPTHIIHTAAMTNVDQCEDSPEECILINTTSVSYLFEESKRLNAHFQLLSTDFVFDGQIGNYKEDDTVNPLSVYAKSKVRAEEFLQNDAYKNWSIVRTIIVYGTANNLSRSNIVVWAKSALQKGDKMTIVDDQFRAPTWADDLAWACLAICEKVHTGIFHICGPEIMSIFSIVERIAKYYTLSTENLQKTNSLQLNQSAKRPPKTGFDLSKARKILGYSPKTLEQTLDLI